MFFRLDEEERGKKGEKEEKIGDAWLQPRQICKQSSKVYPLIVTDRVSTLPSRFRTTNS